MPTIVAPFVVELQRDACQVCVDVEVGDDLLGGGAGYAGRAHPVRPAATTNVHVPPPSTSATIRRSPFHVTTHAGRTSASA